MDTFEPSLGSPGKSIQEEKTAEVFIIEIPPALWRENVLLLQIRRGEAEHQARAMS